MGDHMSPFTKTAIVVSILIAITGLIIWAVHDDDSWRKWCNSQGGHVISNTKTSYGVTTNGKPGFVTTTTNYCLSADGRILDIR
jgi:hypothetical protein